MHVSERLHRARAMHAWAVTPGEARVIQEQLRPRVERQDRLLRPVRYLAGVDVGFEDQGRITRAAVVVLDAHTLEPVGQALTRRPTTFPYIPGLLSFRELPAILDALEQLSPWPDLFLCDGQGIAHPRRLGIAAHLGVLLDWPAIGVAKSRLIGEHPILPEEKGAWVELRDHGECVGAFLRTRAQVLPVFVSIGHRISLPTTVEWVMRTITRYRLPETTRRADRLASAPAHERRRLHRK